MKKTAILAVLSLLALSATAHGAALSNGRIEADFDARDLAAIADVTSQDQHALSQDAFSITLDGQAFDSRLCPPRRARTGEAAQCFVGRRVPISSMSSTKCSLAALCQQAHAGVLSGAQSRAHR